MCCGYSFPWLIPSPIIKALEVKMKFTLKVWKFTIEIDIFDVNPSDGNVACRITVSWK